MRRLLKSIMSHNVYKHTKFEAEHLITLILISDFELKITENGLISLPFTEKWLADAFLYVITYLCPSELR